MINESFIGKKKLTDEDIFDLKELVKLVIYKHFDKYIDNSTIYDDLFSIGMETCLKALGSGKFVKGKGKLFSYLYTGVRNYIGNYLSKNSRLIFVDDELLDCMNHTGYTGYTDLVVTDADIINYVGKLIKDNDTLIKIKSYLKFIGFFVDYEDTIVAERQDSVDKEVALILWTILQ